MGCFPVWMVLRVSAGGAFTGMQAERFAWLAEVVRGQRSGSGAGCGGSGGAGGGVLPHQPHVAAIRPAVWDASGASVCRVIRRLWPLPAPATGSAAGRRRRRRQVVDRGRNLDPVPGPHGRCLGDGLPVSGECAGPHRRGQPPGHRIGPPGNKTPTSDGTRTHPPPRPGRQSMPTAPTSEPA